MQVLSVPTSNIIILTTPRSGSNLLCTLLDSHPQLKCAGEIFNQRELKKIYPSWFVKAIYRFPMLFIAYKSWRHAKQKPFFGFKVFPFHIYKMSPILKPLEKKGYRFIRLIRNDSLKKAISFTIAQNNDKWVVHSEAEYNQNTTHLDPNQVMNYLNYLKEQEAEIDKLLQNIPCILVDYEADLKNPNHRTIWSKHICQQLGLPEHSLTSNMLPTDKRPDHQRIDNLPEIFEFLSQHGFQQEVNYYIQSQSEYVVS